MVLEARFCKLPRLCEFVDSGATLAGMMLGGCAAVIMPFICIFSELQVRETERARGRGRIQNRPDALRALAEKLGRGAVEGTA